ncbi:hypothetical protein ACFL29_00485 [Patescibacteria group bacterium]
MSSLFKILKIILKNFLAFLIGGVVGVAVALLFFVGSILEQMAAKTGLAIVALGPVVIIIYSIIFGALGGVLGIILYNIIKLINKRRKK